MRVHSAVTGAVLLVVGAVDAAQAGTVALSDLFPTDDSPFTIRMQAGETRYVFFEAQETLRLDAITVFGTPIGTNSNSDYRFGLFHTDAGWQTPNGNGDLLFYEQSFFTDIGKGSYSRPTDNFFGNPAVITLEAGERYRLSFQIANVAWDLPHFGGTPVPLPFRTTDSLFDVYGTSTVAVPGSAPRGLPGFSLTVEPVPLPRSASSGLTLIGCVAACSLLRNRRPTRL